MDQFEVVVSKAEALTPRIREFVLARANGAPMPGWAAGAHIDVHLPDVGRRSYSLIETIVDRARPPSIRPPIASPCCRKARAAAAPLSCTAQGRRSPDDLAAGEQFSAWRGRRRSRAGRRRHRRDAAALDGLRIERGEAAVLVSSMPAAAASELAFLGEIEALASASTTIHTDDEAGRFFDLEGLMTRLASRRAALPLRTDADDRGGDRAAPSRSTGRRGGCISKSSARPKRTPASQSFEVELKNSGKTFTRFRPARPFSTCCSKPAKTRCMTASAAIAASARSASSKARPTIATTS